MTPAATRRMHRAATLAEATLTHLSRGHGGQNLQHFLIDRGPAVIWRDEQGHHCRCYGLQSPPANSATAAIATWAHMTLQQAEEDKPMIPTHPAPALLPTKLLASLATADTDKRRAMIESAVIEAGGTYIRPEGTTTHLFELQLYHVSATGFSEDEAIRNWMKNAERQCQALAQAHGAGVM